MTNKHIMRVLCAMRENKKYDAIVHGRYGHPFTAGRYDGRDKPKAFRCIAYDRDVVEINVLEAVIGILDNFLPKEVDR